MDGRKTFAEIAKDTGLTGEKVKGSYDALEQMGVILGSTIHINYKSFGYKAVVHTLVNVDSSRAEQLGEFLSKMPEIYFLYNRGPKGNLDVTITIKTLQELDKIKDSIKNKFSVSEIKTAIWTDVREMHWNLTVGHSIIPKTKELTSNKTSSPTSGVAKKKVSVDEIDRKIADCLAENGRVSMESIAKETGISVDAAKRKYEKLKKNGVLKVTIQFDPTKIGYLAMGVFFVTTSNVNSTSIIDAICDIPDVISIMKTIGDYDLQIYAFIKDLKQLLSIQDMLGRISGLSKIDLEILPLPNKWPSPRQYISTF